MEDGFRLQDLRIAIVGLGLMGGSLALALKGKCAALYGIDADLATLELARANRVVDQAESDPARLVPQANVVILAIPIPAILDFIQKLPSFMPSPCILFDLGSTKKDILRAMFDLPENFDPAGGHPICGKEKLGLEHADASLFQDAAFVVTPLERTTPRAKSVIQQIIAALGANRIELAADDHDRILASTSHLPFVLSSALALSTSPSLAPFIGSGFRSTSRLAGTSSHMMLGVLQSNRENILGAVEAFRHSLHQIEIALKNKDDDQLELLLHQSRSVYQSLLSIP